MDKPIFLKAKDVANLIGVDPQALRRWVKIGTFPKPVVLSRKSHLWPRKVIEQWLAEQTK